MDIKTIQTLVQLAGQRNDPAGIQAFNAELTKAWGPLVDHQIVGLLRQSPTLPPDFRRVVFLELGHLMGQLLATDWAYVVDQAESIATELVAAVHWKVTVQDAPLAEVATWGRSRQADILRWMDRIDQQPGQTHLKRLLMYLNAADRLAVAHRMLRTLAHSVIQNKRPLFELHNGRVELSDAVGQPYFFDQIALYVYLFKNKEEADFLKDALLKVRAYAYKKLLSRKAVDPDASAKDIMGQIQLDFVSHYDKQRTDPFFLNVRLTTYLDSFVDKQPEFKGDKKEQRLPDAYDRSDEDDRSAKDDPRKDILKICKLRVEERCRSLIDMHYDNLRSQPLPLREMAHELGRRAKQVEGELRSCMEKLLKQVVAECERQHLIFYPR